MIGHALIRRYAMSALRARHLWVAVGIYAIGLSLLGVLNALALKYGTAYGGDVRLCLRSVYGQLLLIQFLVLWIWGACNAGSALREEMLRKSYDFFRLLPLSSWQKLVGVGVGRNLLALALSCATAVVQLVAGLVGGVPLFLQVQIGFAVVAVTALVWCVAVLSSVRPRGKRGQRSVTALLLIFLALWVVPALIRLVFVASEVVALERWRVPFFMGDLPGMLFAGFIATYLACWAAFGAMRRLNQAEWPVFSTSGAYRFLVGGLIIMLGLFWRELLGEEHETWFLYATLTHVLLILIPLGHMRTYEQYMEMTYDLARRHAGRKSIGRAFLARVNPAAWGGLYALWAVFVVGIAAVQSLRMVPWALLLVVSVSFAWSVLVLLAELAIVGTARNEKLKFFAGFLALLYLILPLVLVGVLNRGALYSFSYFGSWMAVWNYAFTGDAGEMVLVPPLLVNVMITVVLASLVWRRYQGLLLARCSMPERRDVP